MVGLAQGSHHLSFHELPTAMAACPVHPLVVQGAEILSVLYEEATLGQVTAAHCGKTKFTSGYVVCPAAGTVAPLLAVHLLYDLSGLGLGEGTGTKSYLLLGSDLSLASLPFSFLSFGSDAISYTSKLHWPGLNVFCGMSKIQR